MELQQLKYFREVAKREHVTRAAEKPYHTIQLASTLLVSELLLYKQAQKPGKNDTLRGSSANRKLSRNGARGSWPD
jgi:hypothetical protein